MDDDLQLRCPAAPRYAEDLVGCGSSNISGPDEEGCYDCLDCGLFFTAQATTPIARDASCAQTSSSSSAT